MLLRGGFVKKEIFTASSIASVFNLELAASPTGIGQTITWRVDITCARASGGVLLKHGGHSGVLAGGWVEGLRACSFET